MARPCRRTANANIRCSHGSADLNEKKHYYHFRGGLSQPKYLRYRAHRKRAVLEGSHWVGMMGRASRKLHGGENSSRCKLLAASAAPKTTRLNPSTCSDSSPVQSPAVQLDRDRRPAIHGRPHRRAARRGQGEESPSPGSRSRLVAPAAQLFFFFFVPRAILLKSTYLMWLPQVEFYFSDSNLPRDKFLRETVEQSDDGCKDTSPTASISLLFGLFGFVGDLLNFCCFCQLCSGELALDMLLRADEVPPGAGR